MSTILVVEDEEKIAALLCDYLKQSGFDTQHIANGDDVLEWVQKNDTDLVLLDVMLPGRDGLSICRELRETSDIPVILITARVEEIDRILGLEIGADDYVCKPFSVREVVARVKAILRRSHANPRPGEGSYRGLVIDSECFEASVDKKALRLTPVEFRILKLLLQQPGRVYSRDALIEAMYVDNRVVSDRTVDSHVKNLRKKLIAATEDENWIHSIYGIGYKLD